MTESTIDRRELLPQLFPAPQDYLMVSGLAGASRDAAALTGDGERVLISACKFDIIGTTLTIVNRFFRGRVRCFIHC